MGGTGPKDRAPPTGDPGGLLTFLETEARRTGAGSRDPRAGLSERPAAMRSTCVREKRATGAEGSELRAAMASALRFVPPPRAPGERRRLEVRGMDGVPTARRGTKRRPVATGPRLPSFSSASVLKGLMRPSFVYSFSLDVTFFRASREFSKSTGVFTPA